MALDPVSGPLFASGGNAPIAAAGNPCARVHVPSDPLILGCVGDIKYTPFINFIFYGTLLATFITEDRDECAHRCAENAFCESANFHKNRRLCELNADAKSNDPGNYQFRQTVDYLEKATCETIESRMNLESCGRSDVPGRMLPSSAYFERYLNMPLEYAFEARPHSQPWLVSVQYNGVHTCSAVLIHQYYALTSASCFESATDASMYKAVVGDHSLSLFDPEQRILQLETIMQHEAYSGDSGRTHDIALIKFTTEATVGRHTSAICPPDYDVNQAISDNEQKAYTDCITVGWGKIGGYNYVDRLTVLSTSTIKLSQCNSQKFYWTKVADTMICAGRESSKSCQPDVGGPLLCQRNGSWHVVGVSSWGEGCVRPSKPQVFTNVYYYLDWIRTSTASGRALS